MDRDVAVREVDERTGCDVLYARTCLVASGGLADLVEVGLLVGVAVVSEREARVGACSDSLRWEKRAGRRVNQGGHPREREILTEDVKTCGRRGETPGSDALPVRDGLIDGADHVAVLVVRVDRDVDPERAASGPARS